MLQQVIKLLHATVMRVNTLSDTCVHDCIGTLMDLQYIRSTM